ncbi:MAG: HlyD family efflux transporter periplasmic adaptor subunit [Myxococcota bacterium]
MVALGAGVTAGVMNAGAKKAEASKSTDAGPLAPPGDIVAEAVVTPVEFVSLSLPIGGTIVEIAAHEGQRVQAGALIARLDGREASARLNSARAELQRAVAHLKEIRSPMRPQELAVRDAMIAQTKTEEDRLRSELDRLTQLHARSAAAPADVERARSALERAAAMRRQAEAERELAVLGPRPETIAVAEAAVETARATVKQAETASHNLELRAPIAGEVAYLDLRVGEFAPPGTPIVRLADTSRWVLKTDDLTELAVVRVNENAAVTVTLDAIPGLELSGRVTHVRALGERKKGDMTYTATIELDRQDERLRWNMTASVRINSKQPTATVGSPG